MKTLSRALCMMLVLIFGTSFVFAADAAITAGKKIKFDYTLTVNNEQIETTVGKTPLEFTFGDNSIIPGLAKAMEGMHAGEEKMVTVLPDQADGLSDPQAIKEFPKTAMPKEVELKQGVVLQATAPDGQKFPAVIKEVKGDNVILDFNHPLAGKTLNFKIKIVSVQ